MKHDWTNFALAAAFSACLSTGASATDEARIKVISDAAIQPIMDKNGIPGMAVAISVNGQDYIFNYGVVSKETGKPVSPTTLFELGSVSKTLTVTLTSYAEV